MARVGDQAIPVPITVSVGSDDVTGPGARVIVDVVEGRLEARVVELEAKEGGRGIRQGDLSAVKLADLVEEAMTRWATPLVSEPRPGVHTITATLGTPSDRAAAKRALRAAGAVDLRRVAQVYASADNKPTEAVSEAFGVSHRTASLYAQQARAAGLLPPSKHGRREG